MMIWLFLHTSTHAQKNEAGGSIDWFKFHCSFSNYSKNWFIPDWFDSIKLHSTSFPHKAKGKPLVSCTKKKQTQSLPWYYPIIRDPLLTLFSYSTTTNASYVTIAAIAAAGFVVAKLFLSSSLSELLSLSSLSLSHYNKNDRSRSKQYYHKYDSNKDRGTIQPKLLLCSRGWNGQTADQGIWMF